jgi:penicillin-binding protein 2
VAGKTGTAQTPGDRPTHAWFVGFGPYRDAEIVVVVMIEEGGEGSSVATPLAHDIFFWWFEKRT